MIFRPYMEMVQDISIPKQMDGLLKLSCFLKDYQSWRWIIGSPELYIGHQKSAFPVAALLLVKAIFW